MFWKKRSIPYAVKLLMYSEIRARSKLINLGDYELTPYGRIFWWKPKQMWMTVYHQEHHFEIFLWRKIIPIIVSSSKNEVYVSFFTFTFPFEQLLAKTVRQKSLEHYESTVGVGHGFAVLEIRGKSLKEQSYPGSAPESTKSIQQETRIPILYSDEALRLGYQVFPGFDVSELQNIPENVKSKFQFDSNGTHVFQVVRSWLLARRWYNERGITWKRSILLHGAPGNGKSSLITEIAKLLQLRVFLFDLSSMDNKEFATSLKGIEEEPGIILFEDLDTVFSGRENVTKQERFGVTFESLINKLDGVNSVRNKFIFMTTNHLNKLDPALIRAGRVDEIIEIKPLGAEEKNALAKQVLSPHSDLIVRAISEGAHDTTAEFQNRCTKLALERFWRKESE